ncbi:MAG TPA: isoprenylcysteine carboxylmethyltransferase family protein [Geobacteraceae bacterium]
MLPDMIDFIARFALFAAVHSFLAAETAKEWLRSRIGMAMRGYRLGYNLVSILLFGWVMAAWRQSPVIYALPRLLALPLYAVEACLLIILAVCASQTGIGDFLGFRQLLGRSGREGLVTTGCYGRVRHPQYTLAIAFLLFTPIMTAKWLVLTLLSVPYLVFGALLEEKRLGGEFGTAYRRYRERVPMFIPRFRRQ